MLPGQVGTSRVSHFKVLDFAMIQCQSQWIMLRLQPKFILKHIYILGYIYLNDIIFIYYFHIIYI